MHRHGPFLSGDVSQGFRAARKERTRSLKLPLTISASRHSALSAVFLCDTMASQLSLPLYPSHGPLSGAPIARPGKAHTPQKGDGFSPHYSR